MTGNKVDKYNIWRESAFKDFRKDLEEGEWTRAKERKLKSSNDFLDWLDERDGKPDNIVTSSQSMCIPEDDLWNKISEIKTTSDRQEEILHSVTKFVPTCEMFNKESRKRLKYFHIHPKKGSSLAFLILNLFKKGSSLAFLILNFPL